MKRRIVTWVILFVFLVSSWACIVVRSVELELPEQAALRGDQITAVYPKSGNVISFSAKNLARIVGKTVVGDMVADPGEPLVSKSIPFSEVKFVEVRRVNKGMTFLASVGCLALIWMVLFVPN